jgi:hypothetical protein
MRPEGQWAISVNGSTSVLQADRGGSSPPLSTTSCAGGVNMSVERVLVVVILVVLAAWLIMTLL